jgi:hypothetical protein
MSAFSKDTSNDNSHIRPYSSYMGTR